MTTQMYRVLARSPVRIRQFHIFRLPLFCFSHLLFVLFLTSAIVLDPALFLTPRAVNTASDTQGVAAQSSCHGVYHIVRPGQTIHSIAAAYGTTAFRIANCNRLYSYTVYVGQSLLVPIYRPSRGW